MAVRAGFVVFAIASGIVLMVLGGCYNSPGVHNALVGTSIAFIGVAIVGTVLAVCELGNMKHGDRA
jgi:FtsH-binding integral membrane protein